MKRTGLFALFAIAAGTLLGAASGCELIASVDRTKIAEGGGGAGGATGGGGTTTTGGTGGTGGVMCDPASCPAPSSECKVAACDAAGMCIEENAPENSDAPTQASGDCKKNVCVGGEVMSQNDDDDPLDDGNDCTVDTCVAGSTQSDPAASGVACNSNGGKVCDGMSACVECLENADCTDPAEPECQMNQCVPATCDDGILNGSETDLDCGGLCKKCDTNQDCDVDADCYHGDCGGNNKCVAPACDDGLQNGGDYLMDNGETDVDCGGPCQTKCGASKGCDVNADCVGDECTGMNGTCVPNCQDTELNNAETDVDCGGGTCGGCAVGQDCGMSDSNCIMTAYCSGGTCAAKKAPGVTCAAMNECLMGVCDATDMVCCNMACSGTCQSCKLAGSAGTCTPVASGDDPDNECAGTQACNGAGECRKPNGESCNMGSECLSDNCVDGVCCNVACGGLCKACDVAGSVGTCTNVPSGQDPANECADALSCNGSGICQKADGMACSGAAECGSGNCVDDVCCNTACTGFCQSCNAAGSVGTCTPYAAGSDPEGECSGGTPDCNGNNACGKGPAGVVCVVNMMDNACFGDAACPVGNICGPGLTGNPCLPGAMNACSDGMGGFVACPVGGTCP